MRRHWKVILVLVTMIIAGAVWSSSTITAKPNVEFLVVVMERGTGGNWIAHHYGTDIQCLIENSADHNFEPGQVINVHGYRRGDKNGRQVIAAGAIEVDVPQYFPTGIDFDDSETPVLSDPTVPHMGTLPPGYYTHLCGVVMGEHEDDPDRYLFAVEDGTTWILYFPVAHKNFLEGDEFEAVGVPDEPMAGYPVLVMDRIIWREVDNWVGDFPGTAIRSLDVVEWDPPYRIVLVVDGDPPLSDYHIGYEFYAELDGTTQYVRPTGDSRIRRLPDGRTLIITVFDHEDRHELAGANWTLFVGPSFADIRAEFDLVPPEL